MGKCPDIEKFDHDAAEPDGYWKLVFSDLELIIHRYLGREIDAADLSEIYDIGGLGEYLWSNIFLFKVDQHAGSRDLAALERIEFLLSELAKVQLSTYAATQLSLQSARDTDFKSRTHPINGSNDSRPTAYDATECLPLMHQLLKGPLERVHFAVLSAYERDANINSVNWDGVNAMRGCLAFWNVVTGGDRGFGRPKLETKFGQFVHDVWEYFSISGQPSSAMNALKKLQGTHCQ